MNKQPKLLETQVSLNSSKSKVTEGTFKQRQSQNRTTHCAFSIGLCVRGIDKHLNCPDSCRTKGLNFCKKAVHSIGVCGAYVPEELRLYTAEKEEKSAKAISEEFRRWHAMIPPANRMPISFFEHFVGRRELFLNAFEAQVAALKVPFCICEPFYSVS